MLKKLLTTKSMCLSGLIGALYAALTLLMAPISFGAVQCRMSEAMTLLPIVMPQAIPGLFVGCILANLYTGSVLDIVFGSLATLIAALGTYAFRKRTWLAALCPIFTNGVIVGAVLSVTQGWPIGLTIVQLALGETGAVLIGFVLISALKRAKLDFTKL